MTKMLKYAAAAVLALMLTVGLVGDMVEAQVGPGGAWVAVAVGTSGSSVPLLNGTNTWSAVQTHTSPINVGAIASGVGDTSAVPVNTAAQTISPRLFSTCGLNAAIATNLTSTANAASTDAYVAEVFVPANVSTTGAAVYQVATNNGNDTLYLADAAGNQVAHTASTASAGASQYQLIPWTTSPITIQGPATYYLVATNSATSNTWGAIIGPSTCGTVLLTSKTYGTFPTFTPPTTFVTLQGVLMSLY